VTRDIGADLEALAAAVPPGVTFVCSRLVEAGYQAFTVGGAVRDTLLGRRAGDWDVTTSAHPDEIRGLFRKVLPTGIEHGTVTVIVGRGDEREAIEVTAFRGEGEYSDGRRPDEVTFGVPIDEDLARRDFVINAIAFDPVARAIHDPFSGVDDLDRRIIRAVGEPERRFAEDGLRIMRAVRFAATLEFEVEPATEAAIPGAIPSLEKVSRERVHDELFKLLRAARPSLGLEVALRTGIIASVFPELRRRHTVDWARLMERVDRVEADPVIRGALLFAADDAKSPSEDVDDAAREQANEVCRRLKWSNQDRKRCAALVGMGRPGPWIGLDEVGTRRRLARFERASVPDLRSFLAAYRGEGADIEAVETTIEAILARGDALAIADLAVAGRDLIAELGVAPGKHLGEALEQLLDEVLADPDKNQRETLLQRARAIFGAGGPS